MVLVFIAVMGILVYAWIVYPVLVLWLGRGVQSRKSKVESPALGVQSSNSSPYSIAVLISAHNEESVILQRLDNLAALDYPAERLHVYLGVDGGTDRTAELVRQWGLARTPSPRPSPLRGEGEDHPSPRPSPLRGEGEDHPSPRPSPLGGEGEDHPSPRPSPLRGEGEERTGGSLSLHPRPFGERAGVRGAALCQSDFPASCFHLTLLVSEQNFGKSAMLKKLVECVTRDVKGQKLKVECSKLNVQSSTSSLSEIPFSKGQGVGSPLVPASGLCLVFTDANTMFAPDALRRLVQPFSDSKVGGVCGRLVFEDCVTFNSSSEPSYWNLETRLKVAESELDSCLGANGAIYAIRAELFPSLFPENTIIDDFVIGMKVREQGCRFVFAPDAMATEELPATIQDEWRRRVRIGAGAYQALVLCRRCLLPVYGVFAWMFWSHKVLRWFTPHMGVGVLWMSGYWLLAGDDRVAGVLLGSLLVIAIMAGLTKRGRKGCQLFAYFLVIQVALFAGFLRFCRGNLSGTWIRTGRKG